MIDVLKATRVFVIESHPLVGKALCTLLAQSAEIEVIGDAAVARADVLRHHAPELIVIDIDSHPTDVETALDECRRAVPSARMCVLSMHLRVDVMQRALAAGADGYIVKDVSPAALVDAIHTMASGGFYVDSRLAANVLRRQARGGARDLSELSPRERDVLRLVAGGLTNKEIGERLYLSPRTVKNHVSRIFSKLEVTARTQAVIHAIRSGIA